jgi:hypothetical protein
MNHYILPLPLRPEDLGFISPPELGFSTEHGAEEPEGDGAEETELRSRKEETTPAHVGGNAGEERYRLIVL